MPRTHASAARTSTRTADVSSVERFVVDGRVYRWEERARQLFAEPAIAPRETLATLFTRTIVPRAERLGARGLAFEAATPAGVPVGDLRWVTWRAVGEGAPVWGLYLAARWLAPGVEAPANDAFVLIAWGEGAALAWADERDAARAALRAALRALPTWAERGIRSRDATFPVSVELVRRAGESRDSARAALAVVPPVARRHAISLPARPEVLLNIVRAWRAAHGAESPA